MDVTQQAVPCRHLYFPGAKKTQQIFFAVAGESEFESVQLKGAAQHFNPNFIDSGLSARGKRQALRLKRLYRAWSLGFILDAVITSPLSRSIQTVSLSMSPVKHMEMNGSSAKLKQLQLGICTYLADIGNVISNLGRPIKEATRVGEPNIRVKDWNIDQTCGWANAANGTTEGLLPVLDFKNKSILLKESKQELCKRAEKSWRYLIDLNYSSICVVTHPHTLSAMMSPEVLTAMGVGNINQDSRSGSKIFDHLEAGTFFLVNVIPSHLSSTKWKQSFPWYQSSLSPSREKRELLDIRTLKDAIQRHKHVDFCESIKTEHVIILLGHCLYLDGSPSTTFRRRIKKAAELYKDLTSNYSNSPSNMVTQRR